jgi:hypothetical protein
LRLSWKRCLVSRRKTIDAISSGYVTAQPEVQLEPDSAATSKTKKN